MFLKKSFSSEVEKSGAGVGVGKAFCARAPTPKKKTANKTMPKWQSDLLLLRMVLLLFSGFPKKSPDALAGARTSLSAKRAQHAQISSPIVRASRSCGQGCPRSIQTLHFKGRASFTW